MKFNRDESITFDVLDQDTDEWLEWRQKGLGSSDIALLMSPERQYDRDLLTLWRDRTGIEPHPFVENEHTKRGKELEPQIRDAVNSMLRSNYQPHCVRRTDAPYLRASLDGYDFDTDSILEIKSPSDKVYNKYLEDWEVPQNYMYQMQYQMLVCGARFGWFSFFNSQSPHPKLIYVPANLEMQSEIERRSHLLWYAVETKTPIGFVGQELTLMPQRPIAFFCIGEKPPFPVEEFHKNRTKPSEHSLFVNVGNAFSCIQEIAKIHPNHEVRIVGGRGTPFSPELWFD